MSTTINIIIPMAGHGSRFAQAGYEKPKPFIDVAGIPMIEQVLKNMDYPGAQFYLIGRKEHLQKEAELVNYLTEKYNATFVSIDHVTEGTACTVLFTKEFIDNETPLLIANSDQLVDIEIANFIDDNFNRGLNGSILCFDDEELNPKWSFAKTANNGLVTLVKEKEAISKHATVGVYLFSKGSSFVNAAIEMIIKNDRVNNEFYTCPAYNYAIAKGEKIGIYSILQNQMHGLGTPEDLQKYLSHKK
jgi:dTDP-glucose pyrophosphorylase